MVHTQATASENLIQFIVGSSCATLSPEAVRQVKIHIVDTVAAMISGTALPVGRRALDLVPSLGGPGEALVIGANATLPAYWSAMINAMLAHADETDDSHEPSRFHPGCAIVPAALALGQKRAVAGDVVIRAVALGYDVGARVLEALGPMPMNFAGHASHAIGPLFGCGAVAAHLLAFDAVAVRRLLSYLGHEASGLSCWMSDSDHVQKAYVFGAMAVRNALFAAVLCEHGWTGNEEIIDGERGLMRAFGQASHGRALTEPLAFGAEILRSDIKKWCVGSPVQAPLDCLEALLGEIPRDVSQIDHIEVEIHADEVFIVQTRNIPSISLEYLLALFLVDRGLTFESVHDVVRVSDPGIQSLRRRIRLIPSVALQEAGGRQGIVRVYLTDGRVLRHHTTHVRGTWRNPMSEEEVGAKARALVEPVLGATATARLLDGLWHLDALSAGEWMGRLALTAAAGTGRAAHAVEGM